MATLQRIGKGFGFLAILVAAAACSRGASPSAQDNDVGGPATVPPKPSAAPAATAGAAAAEAEPADGAKAAPRGGRGEARAKRAAAAPKQPTDRPGLGTEWGESRTSQITNVSFDRANTRKPFATAQLFYNDEQGARAMASAEGFHRTASGLVPIADGAFTVGLRDGSGRFLSGYAANGKDFIIGEAGQRYTIVLKNQTDFRMEAVISVDGLDVMDGKSASFKKRGYIVAPRSELEVDGFRQSMDAVAAFRFASVRDSYANKKHGDTRNVGVIGVAVFHERGTNPFAWARNDVEDRRRANPFPGGFASPP